MFSSRGWESLTFPIRWVENSVNSARFCPLCQCADLHGLSKIHLKHFWSLFRPPFFGNSSFFLFFFPLTLRTHTFSSSYGTYQPNSCQMGFCPIDILAKPRPPTTFPLSHRSPFSAVAILVQKKTLFHLPHSPPRARPKFTPPTSAKHRTPATFSRHQGGAVAPALLPWATP